MVDIASKMPEETDEQEEAKYKKYQESFVYADSAVQLALDQSVTYLRRAIVNGRIALFEGVFSAIGTVDDVKEDCERSIQLNNGGDYVQALSHFVLGRTHAKVCEKAYLVRLPLGLGWGDMEVAIREFQFAIKLKPNYRMFYLYLAKAYIEEDECTGDEVCVDICPEVFKMNDDGIAVVHNPTGADEDKIQEAIDECPVACILWKE